MFIDDYDLDDPLYEVHATVCLYLYCISSYLPAATTRPGFDPAPLIHNQVTLDLGKSFEERLEQIDVRPHIARPAGLADRVHRQLRQTNIDCPHVGGQVGSDRRPA